MCVPVAIGLGIAAAAAQIGGQITKGIGDSRIAKYEASVADTNAQLANAQARDAIQNTNLEAQRHSREVSQLKGQQMAALAANGVSLDFGSAVDIQRDTAMTAAEDTSQIYKQGYEKTRGNEIQAFNYRSSADASRAKAKAAITGAIFGSLSTALGSASQLTKKGA